MRSRRSIGWRPWGGGFNSVLQFEQFRTVPDDLFEIAFATDLPVQVSIFHFQSKLASKLWAAPRSRRSVVWTLAVYSTLSSWVIVRFP